MRAFRRAHEKVELELHENAVADLTEALMRRDLQIALLREPVVRPPDLAFIELAHEDLLVVLPLGHRLFGSADYQGVLDLRDLAQERFILVRRPGAPGIYQNVTVACRAPGFAPIVAAEVGHMLTNINLVAAGAGISLVPASMQEVNLRQVGYCHVRSSPPLTVPLTLAYRADNATPLVDNLIAIAGTLRSDDVGTALAAAWPRL
jgi:DNA-binding transcriptional LysR family regulator